VECIDRVDALKSLNHDWQDFSSRSKGKNSTLLSFILDGIMLIFKILVHPEVIWEILVRSVFSYLTPNPSPWQREGLKTQTFEIICHSDPDASGEEFRSPQWPTPGNASILKRPGF